MEIKLGPLTCGIYLFDLRTQTLLIGHVTGLGDIYSIPKGEPDPVDADDWESATRETLEETGIDVYKLPQFKKCEEYEKVKYPNKERWLKSFFCTFYSDENNFPKTECTSFFIKQSDGTQHPEIDDFKWISLKDSPQYLPPVQLHNLPKIEKYLNEN